jgi:secreted trypsin-like serine protease
MRLWPLAVRTVAGLLIAGLTGVSPSPSSAVPSTSIAVDREHRIVGGKNTDIRAIPWQVFVYRDAVGPGGYICGGSFISSRWIITAAHCVTDDGGAVVATTELTVYSGMNNLLTINASHESLVTQIQRHPDYAASPASIINDIALVELANPVTFGSKRAAIALPFDADATTWPANKTAVRISGWGRTSTNGSSSDIVKSATINVKGGPLDALSCGNWSLAAEYNPVQNLCAGWKRNGKDICQGDSGGPYAINVNGLWTLAGVTSYNSGLCGKAALPGIAVRITTFRDWLISPPPENLTWVYSDPADTSATLTWDTPPDTAIMGNNGYYIEKSMDNGTTWTATSEGIVTLGVTTTERLCDVPAGCVFRVAAVTDVNQDVGPYRFSSIPSQPRGIKVVRKSAQYVTLSWQPPSRAYESTIQDYQVYWSSSANGVFSAVQGTVTSAVKHKFQRPASGKLYYVVRARSTVDIPGDDYGASSTAIAVR